MMAQSLWWSLLLAALLGVLMGAMYLGLVPPAQAAVEWLGRQPMVQDAFRDPATGARDALLTLLAFAALGPFAAALAVSAAASALCAAAERLEPAVRALALPAWVPVLIVGAAGVGLGFAVKGLWLPKCLEVLGLAARAYLVWAASV